MAQNTKITAYANGSQTTEIQGLDELEVDSSFISDSRNTDVAQPIITVNELTFIGELAESIILYRQGGVTGLTVGILEGFPLQLYADDGDNSELIFNGFLDFKFYDEITSTKVKCQIVDIRSMNSFNVISKVTYFNILESKGVFKQSDYINAKLLVEKVDQETQLAMMSLTLFVLTVQGIQLFKNIQTDAANAIAHGTGGVTGIIAAPIFLIAVLLVDLIVFALMVVQIIKLIAKMIQTIVPRAENQKLMFYFDLLRVALDHLDLKFETNITEMQNTAYLNGRPSGKNSIPSGVPKVGQPGQTLAEFINIMLNKYDGQIAIIGDVFHLRTVNDPFWIKNSTYILPNTGDGDVSAVDMQSERKTFNIKDFNANRLIQFSRDVSDEYTITNWRGTSFLAITEPKQVNNQKMLLFDGLDEITIPLSLANRKDGLNEVELALFDIATVADLLINLFGSGSNYAALIGGRIGAIKVSQTAYSNAKCVWLEEHEGRLIIPVNHRDKLGAKALYKYHARKSFVNDNPNLLAVKTTDVSVEYEDTNEPNYGNQKLLVDQFPVGFGFEDYLKVKNNSYFATSKGVIGKIEKSKWLVRMGKAIQSYWLKFIWTKNLKETFIEPI